MIWIGDLEGNLKELPARVKAAMVVAANKRAPEIQSWMRENAPWTDRTSNARNGLTAVVSGMGATGRNALGQFTGGGGGDAKNLVIVLSHGVPYGIWLEVRFSGKYAIVTPAIPYWGPKVMTLAAQLAFEEGIANA